jgi:TonB family protein
MVLRLPMQTTQIIGVLPMDAVQNPSPRFETIEFQRTGWTRWTGSLAFHALFAAVIVAVPWSAHELAQPTERHAISLIEPAQPPPAPRRVSALPVIKPIPMPLSKRVVEFKAPPRTAVTAPKQIQVAELPEPPRQEVAKLDLPKIDIPAVPKPAPVVKVGGFGNPEGATPSAAPSSQNLNAPKVGSFDLSAGDSSGRASGGKQVALAGFGDATANSGAGSSGNSRGTVRTGGFGAYETVAPTARAIRPAAIETPVQITFKPKPSYTPEAREKKIEGEVLLEVVFSASGQVHVLRVMRGLGFGLDENAEDAASKIRFQPGTRDGAPIDMKATVHIVFELS